MKMITAIVQNQDANALGKAFVAAKIQATRIASKGGFLRAGNTTFLIGVPDDQVEQTLAIISETSKTRTQIMSPAWYTESVMESINTVPVEVQVGGATVFVQDVEQFHHF
ncbi:cyclic-di-AMP receptor [Weissella halotolerans]|uniref:Uncharacterized protein n=1 Tax=Weissella halotolerans DSM 20190 TaxID=1123500 RepID=A0A0R2FVF1_9LACO|nr:cyclic-di-AMP receptor [Weissella halotolerans]KRN32306.1 hypothetical protein IV68_GL000657 [Weissella halotolerans DSM 20190]